MISPVPELRWNQADCDAISRNASSAAQRADCSFGPPNGWRVSGEPRSEAQGRVRCTRGLGVMTFPPSLESLDEARGVS